MTAIRIRIARPDEIEPVGFALFGTLDGEPYLDQLAVRRAMMRQGIGSRSRWSVRFFPVP